MKLCYCRHFSNDFKFLALTSMICFFIKYFFKNMHKKTRIVNINSSVSLCRVFGGYMGVLLWNNSLNIKTCKLAEQIDISSRLPGALLCPHNNTLLFNHYTFYIKHTFYFSGSQCYDLHILLWNHHDYGRSSNHINPPLCMKVWKWGQQAAASLGVKHPEMGKEPNYTLSVVFF